jgi:hypothetical protein
MSHDGLCSRLCGFGTVEMSTRLGGQGRPHAEGGVQRRGLEKTPWKCHKRWEAVGGQMGARNMHAAATVL